MISNTDIYFIKCSLKINYNKFLFQPAQKLYKSLLIITTRSTSSKVQVTRPASRVVHLEVSMIRVTMANLEPTSSLELLKSTILILWCIDTQVKKRTGYLTLLEVTENFSVYLEQRRDSISQARSQLLAMYIATSDTAGFRNFITSVCYEFWGVPNQHWHLNMFTTYAEISGHCSTARVKVWRWIFAKRCGEMR